MARRNENPSYQQRAAYTPAAARRMLAEDVITKADLLLLWEVEDLVLYGKGCFASNAWLGGKTGMNPRYLSGRIAHLKELGLLKVRVVRGTRWLETAWSNTSLERKFLKLYRCTDSEKPEGGVQKNLNQMSLLRKDTNKRTGVAKTPLRGSKSNKSDNCTTPKRAQRRAEGTYMPRDMFGRGSEGNMSDEEKRQLRWADRLRAAVKAGGNTRGFASEKADWKGTQRYKWAAEFRKLARDVEPDRIEKVLHFYEKHCRKIARPKIANVPHFRKCLESGWLEEIMAKVAPPPVEVDPALKSTVAQVKGYGWPKGAARDVPAFCQLTLQFARDFHKRLIRLAANGSGRTARLANFLLEGAMPRPLNFVEAWAVLTFRDVGDWDDWRGDLTKEVPKPGSKRLTRWGREIAGEYSNAAVWDKLLDEVYE